MILNLTSKLRRKSRRDRGDDKYSLPTRDDPAELVDYHPIDTQEQEELVSSFESSQIQQSFLWRRVFAALFFCYVAFLLFSIFQQASSPWELRFHAYFMDEVQSWIVISADCVAVLASMMAITGLLKSHRQWIWYSCYTGVLLAIFWLHHMLSGAGICLYVDSVFAESLEDVRKLRRYMYAYKAT
ncbi:uncharacterized protein LOC122063174 isoform X2 [Macadamia integrifolia]|uniref:uncharacterized protein LOC122063174 isoform X2 n=1 Tax=Macadamia integrifolia TaxID=60698 RepID=UPI001C4F46FA|nr:uncharacterized protein LOC122063174 isoform X2 [Macadamia integrifolia]